MDNFDEFLSKGWKLYIAATGFTIALVLLCTIICFPAIWMGMEDPEGI